MKTVFWLVGLFAAAVALALLMGQNGATVTLFWLPYRVDMSFNLVLAAVLLLFVLLHLALRSVSALRGLPAQARRWRTLQRERAVNAALLEAQVHQTAGRFVRAKGAAQHAAEWLATEVSSAHSGAVATLLRTRLAMAHLMAAEAAHSLQDTDAQARHLEQALTVAEHPDLATVREAVALRALRWAVDDRRLPTAQRLLAQLPQGAARRTLALRLRLKLAQLNQDHTQAFDTARLLAKHKAFSEGVSESLLRRLRVDLFGDCHDVSQLTGVWRSLDASERRDPVVVLAALSRLLEVMASDPTADAGPGLAREWAEPLLALYPTMGDESRGRFVHVMRGVLPHLDDRWLARVEALQREHPADPCLLFVAAETYHQRQLWGKAAAGFQQAARLLDDSALQSLAWVRLAQLAERRGDDPAALAAWRQAALRGAALDTSDSSPRSSLHNAAVPHLSV